MNIFFSLLKHSAVALDDFFMDKFTSTCKLSQENPEIATEYFVFSVQLFLKSRRRERNSKHSASTWSTVSPFPCVISAINVLAFQSGVLEHALHHAMHHLRGLLAFSHKT